MSQELTSYNVKEFVANWKWVSNQQERAAAGSALSSQTSFGSQKGPPSKPIRRHCHHHPHQNQSTPTAPSTKQVWSRFACLPNFEEDMKGRLFVDILNEPDSQGQGWQPKEGKAGGWLCAGRISGRPGAGTSGCKGVRLPSGGTALVPISTFHPTNQNINPNQIKPNRSSPNPTQQE